MTPLCDRAECRKPVKPRRNNKAVPDPVRGLRMIDGVCWNWYCSQRCAGKAQGCRASASGAIRNVQAWHKRHARQRRLAHYASELARMRHYGVPADVAEEILDRVYRCGTRNGYRCSWLDRQRTAA